MSGELRLLATAACNCLSECPAILSDGTSVLVVGEPTTLPEGAPARAGAHEVVVRIPAQVLDQAVQAELNRLADQARHWQDVQDLRDHHAELRARQANRTD